MSQEIIFRRNLMFYHTKHIERLIKLVPRRDEANYAYHYNDIDVKIVIRHANLLQDSLPARYF